MNKTVVLNYYSIILLGTLKIQTNLLQLAIKISWNIPVCSPFILQQQHLGSESYTSMWLYPHAREASTSGTIQEGWYRVRSVLLFQHFHNVVFLQVSTDVVVVACFPFLPIWNGQFKHHLPEIQSSLDKSRDTMFT